MIPQEIKDKINEYAECRSSPNAVRTDAIYGYSLAAEQLAGKESRIKELEEALKKIENPLEWLQKNLKDTESLNGINAITLSNNANYLKLIASQALNKHKNQ